MPPPAPDAGVEGEEDAGTKLPDPPDAGEPETDAGTPSRFYSLLAPMDDRQVILMDEFGQIAHSWKTETAPGAAVYLYEDGVLARAGRPREVPFPIGGAGGLIEEMDWDGNVLWSFEYNTPTVLAHHDFRRMPNGNYLLIAWEAKSREDMIAAGRHPERSPEVGLFDHLIELDPRSGEIVWEWHLWDHLIQDLDSSKANYGDVAAHPERIDINAISPSMANSMTHVNSVDYNPELDQLLLSVRELNEIWIIDHSTTTTEAAAEFGGRQGKGGDLLYRWGNPQTYRTGTTADRKLFFQHDAIWIRDGLPGAGNVLIFNNGDSATRPWSSVMEITLPETPSGGYMRDANVAFGPTEANWIYSDPPKFFAAFVSGAQRLPNGNTQVCQGVTGRIFEVTPAKEIVWEKNLDRMVFRAERYFPDHPALVGKDLSPKGQLSVD